MSETSVTSQTNMPQGQKKGTPYTGPDNIKWIKIVPAPGNPNQIKVFFMSQGLNNGPKNVGFFILSDNVIGGNNMTARQVAKLLIDKFLDQSPTSYDLTSNANDTKYEFQDTFTVNNGLPIGVKHDPNKCTHETATNFS